MLRMTHPDGLEATCVDIGQFDAVYRLRGWELATDDDGAPVEVDEKVPAHHVPHTPIHPAELRDRTPDANTPSGDDVENDDGEAVDLTRPEED